MSVEQQIILLQAEAQMKAAARKGFDLYFDISGPDKHVKKLLGQKRYDLLLDDLTETLHQALMSKAPKVE